MMRWIKRLVLVLVIVPAILLVVIAVLPGKWLAAQIAAFASDASGLNVEIADASLAVFTLTPGLSLSDIQANEPAGESVASVKLASVSANLRALISDAPLLDLIRVADGSASLQVDDEGRGNWEDWLPTSSNDEAEAETSERATLPAIRSIQVDDMNISYQDDFRELDADITVSAEGSTSDADHPLSAEASGTINDVPVSAKGSAQSLVALATAQADLSVKLALTLGNTSADIEGVIGDPAAFKKLDLAFSIEGEDLRAIETVSSILMPVIPPFQLQGTLLRDSDEFVLQRFDAVVGDSDLQGDVRVNPFSSPPTLYANVISTVLDLDDLAGLIGASPDPDEAVTAEKAEESSQQDDDGRLLPDNPVPLTELGKLVNGEIAFRSSDIRTELFPVESIDTRIQLLPDRLKLEPMSIGVAGGMVEGSLDSQLTADPVSSTLELRVTNVDLGKVMASAGIDNDAFGQIGGRAKYWMSGDTVASMAASADGGMFLLMTEGQVGALLSELAGIDLVESLTLLATDKNELTDIRCAYADLHSAEGLMTIQTFVMDTDDTAFLADGTVDFKDEALDLTIEPHPKDASLLAAQTSVKVGGTLMDPSILPGQTLPLRVAASAILASVAGPAAALLPFLESGSGDSSPYCSGLASSLDDAR